MLRLFLGMMLFFVAAVAGCSNAPREIPMKEMARILMEMLVDGKMVVNQNPRTVVSDSVAPYVERIGYRPEDYQLTADRIDNDSARAGELQRAMLDIIDHDKELGYSFRKMVLTQDLQLEGLDSLSINRLVNELDSNTSRLN
ncbi:MAG: hypothetical protein KDC45_02570 [Bacteroidetes bacterium]|nr:hypothetical protein [Bacteroidota bacterium]